MTVMKFYIDGSEVKYPRNYPELDLQLNWDKDNNVIKSLSTNDFEFTGQVAEDLTDKLYNGSLFQGIPFRIEVQKNGTSEVPFNGFIDPRSAEVDFNTFIANGKERNNIEWLDSQSDFSFNFLRELGLITSADYDFIPYVIDPPNNYTQIATSLVAGYVIVAQIKDCIEKLIELIADIANPFTAISAIVKAALMIAYIATLLVALIKFVKDIITTIIQPVKYHSCMKVKTLMEKGCQHLGLTFDSSILSGTPYEKAYIMPEKYYNPPSTTYETILGYITPSATEQFGEYKGTFKQLYEALKQAFNAKVVIKNGVLYLERRDYNITPPQYVLPNVRETRYKTNADEFKANYYIHFDTDLIEKNTIQTYTGTAYEVVTRQSYSPDFTLQLMDGLEDVFVPFALAKRKTQLTLPEKIIKAILDVVDLLVNAMISIANGVISAVNAAISIINKVIKALGTIGIKIHLTIKPVSSLNYVSLASLIENRLNMMKLESDFTSKPKLFLMDSGTNKKFNKLTTGNETYFSAKYLYNNYHYINSFVPTSDKPNGNQYMIKQFTNVPFGFDELQKVKDNNTIQTFDGKTAIIQDLKWNERHRKADMTVRISTLFSTNFYITTHEGDGK